MEIIVPNIPDFTNCSPELVRVFDKIRFDIDKKDDGELLEFYWFAREYPRFYRYHFDHVEHRLVSIHKKYSMIRDEIMKSSSVYPDLCMAVSNPVTHQIYWDFEAYLMALSTALDLMARVVGVSYSEQTPVSFNKLCSKKHLTGLVDILRKSKAKWVDKLKDYRDCFVHYTPADNRVSAEVTPSSKGIILRCKLPTNPNIRTVEGFKYSMKVELLTYASTLYRHLSALDKAIAKEIMKLYKNGCFPKRTKDLFFIGQRTRKK